MNEEMRYEKIQAYLKGEMTSFEIEDFENKLLINNDLKKDFLFYCSLKEVVKKELELEELREEFGWLKDSIPYKSGSGANEKRIIIKDIQAKKRNSSKLTRFSIAASFLLIVSTATLWYANSNYSNKAIGDTYFQEVAEPTFGGNGYMGPDSSGSINTQKIITEVQNALNESDFQKAIDLLDQVPPQNPLFPQAVLNSGYHSLKIGDYRKAISDFERYLDLKEVENKDRAEWFLLLAMVHSKVDDELILNKLDSIRNNKEHFFQNNVEQLAKDFNSFWRYIAF